MQGQAGREARGEMRSLARRRGGGGCRVAAGGSGSGSGRGRGRFQAGGGQSRWWSRWPHVWAWRERLAVPGGEREALLTFGRRAHLPATLIHRRARLSAVTAVQVPASVPASGRFLLPPRRNGGMAEWRPRLLHPLMLLCPGPRRHAVHCALPSINEHHLHSSAPRRRPPRSPGEEEQCGPSARHVQLPRIDSAPPTSPASSRPVHAGSSAQDKERASSHVAHRCPMRHFVRRRRRAQPCASVHAHRPPRLFITR